MGIRLLFVDDHPAVRESLNLMFDAEGITDYEEAATCEQTRQALKVRDYDVLLLDIALPDGSGLDLLEEIKTDMPRLPIVMHSIHDDLRYMSRSFHHGASGYVVKGEDKNTLIDAVRRAAQGDIAWTEQQKADIHRRDAARRETELRAAETLQKTLFDFG